MKGSWRKAIETFRELRKFRRRNFGVYFGMTLSEHNTGRYEDNYRAAREEIPWLTYNDMHINLAQSSAHYYGCSVSKNEKLNESYLNDIDQVLSTRAFSIHPVRVLENDYIRLTKKYIHTGITPLKCMAMKSSVFLDPYGDVFACSIWDRKLGNIRDFSGNLEKILNSPTATEAKTAIEQFDCPNCWTPCEAYTAILARRSRFPFTIS